jgi:hypothetical protein
MLPRDLAITDLPQEDGALELVRSSWLNGFHCSPWSGPLLRGQFWAAYAPVINALISAPTVRLRAVCPVSDPGLIYSWMASEVRHGEVCVHFCYTKVGEKDLRGKGYARHLLLDAGASLRGGWVFSFLTAHGRDYLTRPYKGRFRPFYVRDHYETAPP